MERIARGARGMGASALHVVQTSAMLLELCALYAAYGALCLLSGLAFVARSIQRPPDSGSG